MNLTSLRQLKDFHKTANDTLAFLRKRTRSAVALIVTAVLVVIAALASVYTAGYVRGECAIMEAEEAR